MPSDRVDEIKRKIDAKEGVNADELKALFAEACKRGAVHALLHFDAYGTSEDEVRNAHVSFLAELTKEKGMLYCKGTMESVLQKEKVFSTISEAEVLADSLLTLARVCLRFGPSAIEVLAPERFTLEQEDAHRLLVQSSEFAQAYAQVFTQRALKENAEKFGEHAKQQLKEGEQLLEQANQDDSKKE